MSYSATSTMATIFNSWPTPASQPMANRVPFLNFANMENRLRNGVGVGMWSGGCLLDDGTYNCTQVCTDPTLLYRQPYVNETVDGSVVYTNVTTMNADEHVPYNIYNCIMYPYISALLTNEQKSKAAYANARSLADTMGIVPNADTVMFDESCTLLERMRSIQWECIWTFCTAHGGCDREYGQENFMGKYNISQSGPGLSLNPSYSFPIWDLISQADSMQVYTDVAGIGVSIAFMIEACVVILCLFYVWFIRWKDSRGSHAATPYTETPKHTHFPSRVEMTDRSRKAMRIAARFVNNHDRKNEEPKEGSIRESVNKAIESFQGAQCFLMISMSICFLIGLCGDGPFMTSQSFGQFWNNLLYTQAVAEGGIAAVCLTQYCLHALRRGSGYYLFLTWGTVAVNIATFVFAQRYIDGADSTRLDVQTADAARDTWQFKCGIVSPQTYNGSLNTSPNPLYYGKWVIVYAAITLISLTIELAWSSSMLADKGIKRWKKWYDLVFSLFYLLIEIYALGWVISFTKNFWYPIRTVVPRSWSLGQVLAVSIWAPGLIELAHAFLRKWKPQTLAKLAKLLPGQRRVEGGGTDEQDIEKQQPRERLMSVQDDAGQAYMVPLLKIDSKQSVKTCNVSEIEFAPSHQDGYSMVDITPQQETHSPLNTHG